MKISPLKTFVIVIIKAYQFLLSPFLVGSCRFLPTCSNYTIESINKYGLKSGLFISLKRILKCHPFYNNTGFDPVP